jgi:uncharacterized membrane protein
MNAPRVTHRIVSSAQQACLARLLGRFCARVPGLPRRRERGLMIVLGVVLIVIGALPGGLNIL